MEEKNVAVVRSIEIVTAEIHTIRDNAAKVFMDAVVQIGRRLEEAKQLVPQGGWTEYLENELGYKPSTAQNYMRIAREFGDGQIGLSGKSPQDVFGDLGYSQLLPLLGLPEEEREAVAEENDLAGMSSREIAALVKERDALAAKAAGLDEAEKRAAEAAEKLKQTKAELSEARGERKDAFAAQKQAREEKAAAEKRAAELQKELDELAAKADEPRELTEDELARVREEVAAEQAEAVRAAEQRAAEAAAKLEKVKNPAAHQVNFLFGELTQTHQRLAAAVNELAKSDPDAAERMRGAINGAVKEWTV